MNLPADISKSVEAFLESLVDAYEEGEIESIIENVREDILVVSGELGTISGRSSFRKLVAEILSNNRIEDFSVSIDDLTSLQGHAFVIASYTWTLVQKSTQKKDVQSGRFAMLLRWQDELQRWQVRREVAF